LTELSFDPAVLEAIIFDVDGTLYRQDSLRRAMAARLLRAHLTRPLTGVRIFRVLGAYRKAQEHLRQAGGSEPILGDLSEAQIRLVCERTGADPAFVGACVDRWMNQEPLSLLANRIQPGLREFIGACTARGLKLGVLSDYPAEAKLRALGLDGLFDVVLAAQSPEIGVFKPHPRGLIVALQRLGVSPDHCLYVGDRADVDGSAATAANVACHIIPATGGFAQVHELVFGATVDRLAQPLLHLR
jgi:beta-phosphoglucomutase-like phosphatase (HAD superfamily)